MLVLSCRSCFDIRVVFSIFSKRPMAGLYHHYLAGVAVDSGDPQNIVVSASQSAWQAHSIQDSKSVVYRRTSSIQDDAEGE